jgi:hypothetical protein
VETLTPDRLDDHEFDFINTEQVYSSTCRDLRDRR